MFYTYLHRRESDNKPFYIGKGQKKRAWSHKNRNLHWSRTVAKHGLKVEICAEWVDEDDSFEHEKFLISCFKDMSHDLVNLTDGGEGSSGLSHSEATKKNLSDLNSGVNHPRYGKPISEDERLKRSASRSGSNHHFYGKRLPPETLVKMSKSHTGKVHSLESRQKRAKSLSIPVICSNGMIFDSGKSAVAWLHLNGHPKATNSKISACCNGSRNIAYGFTWKRAAKSQELKNG
jgi:group I intron endonuclease